MDVPLPTEDALSQPTRARLFALLVELNGEASTEQLSRRLDLHPNGVRRHLQRLSEAGLVLRQRRKGKTGRPRDQWLIAPSANPGGNRPQAYGDLATWLARAISPGPRRLAEIERTGHRIGQELAPAPAEDPTRTFHHVVTSLGFQPSIEADDEGGFCCRLGNCPYRDSVRENASVICTLHRGITSGLLSGLSPEAELERFEAHDPDEAGCLICVRTGQEAGPG
jgi:predicted ArsR family transcriptional regulator